MYTLPTNSQSVYFLFSLLMRKLNRMSTVRSSRKKWNILVSPRKDQIANKMLSENIRRIEGMVPSIDRRYTLLR